MKLSPLTQMKIAAVLGASFVMLGCEAPGTKASEPKPPVYPTATLPTQPDLVTVTNLGVEAASEETEAEARPLVLPEEPFATGPVTLSGRLQEVLQLAESGVGDEVVLAFIQNSPTAFNPTPEEIVYLTDLGLSDVVITALVNHRGTEPQVVQQPAPPQAAAPAPAEQQGLPGTATYDPEPQVVYEAAPGVQYATPAPVAEHAYFYSSLAPYGTWVDVPYYGVAWQPTVAVIDRGWRPYLHRGRWLHTDHGWYWQSDYSWGWAPFHYGRWFHHPARGWCWTPGSVWAPAWVSWRFTDSHCGWAPLPPGAFYHGSGFTYYGAHVGVSFGFGLHREAWAFVPSRHFRHREVWRHRLHSTDHLTVYHRSTVVNNYVVNNNTIINRGPGPDRIPGLDRAEVRKVAIRDLPERGGRGGSVRPDRLHQEGSDLVVYRPKLPGGGQGFRQSEGTRTIESQPARGEGSPGLGQRGDGARPIRALAPEAAGPRGPSVEGTQPKPAVEPRIATRSTQAPAKPAEEIRSGIVTAPGERQTAAPASPASGVVQSRPVSPSQMANRTRPSASLDGLGSSAETRPAPSAVQQPQPVAPQTFRVPTQPNNLSGNPSRSFPGVVVSPTPATPLPARQELAKPSTSVAPERVTPRLQAPAAQPNPAIRSVPAQPSQTFSLPTQARPTPSPTLPAQQSRPTPSFSIPSQPSRPTPSFSVPAQQSRPAPSFSIPSQPSQPTRSFSVPSQPSRPMPSVSVPAQQSRPAPSFSIPSQPSRPAPSFSVPSQPQPSRPAPQAVPSRPAQATPSFSLPASRPAPQAAPAASQTERSGFRR